MNHSSGTSTYWTKPASSPEDWSLVRTLREGTYQAAGKVADPGAYRSPLDEVGQAFLVGLGAHAIGTFSLCNLSRAENAALALGKVDGSRSGAQPSIYVYFLGIQAKHRSAAALTFVFGEVFKFLARNQLESIYVLADARLTRRYRWLGLKPTHQYVMSQFPKSGKLALLHTRQIRAGVYGFHADPIRWNWYLRSPTAELLREGVLPARARHRLVFFAFSAFAPAAALLKKVAALYLRKQKSETPRRPVHVLAV